MTNYFGKQFLLLLSLLSIQALFAQKQSPSQLTILSENDNYTLKRKDRYYTNGLMIRFSTAWNKGSNTKVLTSEVGQLIFNPYKQNANFQKTMDRPFTGFLYARAGVTNIDAAENVFKWSIQAGVVGEAAKGKEVQRWHHKNFGLPYPYGWETQLKSEFGANLQAAYYKHLRDNAKGFDAHVKGALTAGSIFSNISTGFQLKLGLFNRGGESTWWDSRKAIPEKGSSEFFVYLEPTITYQIYNATVQGGLFTRKHDQFTTEIEPIIYSHSFGFMYAKNHWTIGLGITYKTKEAKTMMANENYGSITTGYRF